MNTMTTSVQATDAAKTQCPNCGHTMFDQGLSMLYCGACGNWEARVEKKVALPAPPPALVHGDLVCRPWNDRETGVVTNATCVELMDMVGVTMDNDYGGSWGKTRNWVRRA